MTSTVNNSRIAKNTLFMTMRMLVLMVISLYSSRIVLEALGVVDFGIYNVVAGFVTMFAFMSTSLSSGIQRFFNFELGRNGIIGATKVYNAAIVIQTVFAIILVILLETIGLWYLNYKLVIPPERLFAANWVFQLSILTLILHLLQVPFMAAVMAHEKMGFYALISVLNAIVILCGVFGIKYFSSDALILYAFLQVGAAAFSLTAFAIYAKKHFEEIKFAKTLIKKQLLKEMLSFSGWNIFGTFGNMLRDQGINLVLNSFFGPIINAARGISVQINGALNSLVSNISIPVRPQLVQAYSQGNKNRAYNLTYTISKLTSYALIILVIPIFFDIDFILHIWLGNNVPAYTNTFTQLIILDFLILNLNASISNLVHASGKMKWYQIIGGTMRATSVLCALLCLYLDDNPNIVFVVTLALDILQLWTAVKICVNIENNANFNSSKYLKSVIYPILLVIIIALPFTLLVLNLIDAGLLRLACMIITSSVAVVTAAYFVGLTTNERCLLKSIIAKFKNH